jgi:putative alpha-1,2-mannosidase
MMKSLSVEPARLVGQADSALQELNEDPTQARQKLDGLFNSGNYRRSAEWRGHLPYLYNLVSDPAETQLKVKQILASDYNNYDGGIPGNDLGGQLSAWYVFSAMGFYPLSTALGHYQLSSPIFSEVKLNLDPDYYPGKGLKIVTDKKDATGTFNTVKLNDKKIDFVLTQEDIRAGGALEFSNEKFTKNIN